MRPIGVLLVLCALAFHGGAAFAAMSVFGGTQFTPQSASPRSAFDYDGSSSSRSSYDWSAKIGMGGGISQLVSEDLPGRPSRVTESSMQLNLVGTVERVLVGPLSAEAGLTLGLQFVTMGQRGDTVFSPRYLDLPVVARLYFSRQISMGVGGFLAIPIDSLEGVPASRKLMTTNFGISASARWNIPANRLMDWVVEASVQRGLVHLGDGGLEPNHLRNLAALFGLSAHF